MRRRLGVVLALGLGFSTGPSVAYSATISATPDSGTFRVGDSIEVDLFLNLEDGEVASFFGGAIPAHKGVRRQPGGIFYSVYIREVGPTWTDGAPICSPSDECLRLTSTNLGGRRLLATLGIDFVFAGTFDLTMPNVLVQFDLPHTPGNVPVTNLGKPLGSFTAIPEPTTALLVAIGLTSLAWSRSRASP